MAHGRRGTQPTAATVLGGLVALGVALLVIKWLAITAAILAVPFAAWWLWDHTRGPAVATPGAPAPPPPPFAPRSTPVVGPTTPGPGLVVPERKVTVTREEDHQHVLARHHRPGAAPSRRHADLHSSIVARGTHRGAYAVEVRVGGERVGEMTAAMSERYRPLVRDAEARGRHARCEATVSHGERGFQVELRLPAMA